MKYLYEILSKFYFIYLKENLKDKMKTYNQINLKDRPKQGNYIIMEAFKNYASLIHKVYYSYPTETYNEFNLRMAKSDKNYKDKHKDILLDYTSKYIHTIYINDKIRYIFNEGHANPDYEGEFKE